MQRPSDHRLPLTSIAAAQAAGFVVAGIAWAAVRPAPPFDVLPWLLLQGVVAASFAAWRGAPRWWWLIHAAFMPLLALALRLPIAPGWYLAAFVIVLLVFWRTDVSRVPLYLTNRRTAEALVGLLPAEACRVVDLGCGHAGLLARLARSRPDCHFVGIEHAPLPWLLARLRALRLPNLEVRLGSLWAADLSPFDVAYAFLSPVPMPALWTKALAEMRAGSLLVANSFAVPGVAASRELTVDDRRQTRLYIYRLPGRLAP